MKKGYKYKRRLRTFEDVKTKRQVMAFTTVDAYKHFHNMGLMSLNSARYRVNEVGR